MEVNIELKPIQWTDTQGSLYSGLNWIHVYSIDTIHKKK